MDPRRLTIIRGIAFCLTFIVLEFRPPRQIFWGDQKISFSEGPGYNGTRKGDDRWGG